MSGINQAIILGHVGADPEIRRTQDGRPIASFSIATSEEWRDKNTGEKKERTQWHRVVVFNEGLAKVIEQYVKKGSKLYIQGAIETRKWTDQAGADKYVTEIVLRNFNSTLELCGDRRGGPPPNEDFGRDTTRTSDSGRGAGIAPRNSGGISSGKPSDMDDDIPF